MMHSYHGRDVVIHFNQDFSGEIQIINRISNEKVTISKYDLLNFVAKEYVLPKRISELEEMSHEELIK
jgi:hypothetical protein